MCMCFLAWQGRKGDWDCDACCDEMKRTGRRTYAMRGVGVCVVLDGRMRMRR